MLPRRAWLALGLFAALQVSCGGETGSDGPAFVNVRVAYVSRLPAGCPESANICYPGCAHHNAPSGLQAVVPLWGAGNSVRLDEAGPGRYEGVLVSVPTNTTLRLYGHDIGVCCFDSCNFRPVLEDILLNGTKLTKVVHDGLPAGITGALEFSVTGTGAVRQ